MSDLAIAILCVSILFLWSIIYLLLRMCKKDKIKPRVIQIKSCPCCGGSPYLRCVGDWKTLYIVQCAECDHTSKYAGISKEEAIKLWNREQ